MRLVTNGFRNLLLPFSLLYGCGVWVRNSLFDMGLLRSIRFDIPVIAVGNLTVGGTGKTPMSEYLTRLLSTNLQVAVLSRGYMRKSKGFLVADLSMGTDEVGDEPTQLKQKFPHAVVAVDANRRRGITLLSDENQQPSVDVIVLDDAFQHRFVNPGQTILLMDYNRPLQNDWLLPMGALREPALHYKRADILVFTKCPPDLKPIERRVLSLPFNLENHQSVFYTTLKYGALIPMVRTDNTPLWTMEQIKLKQVPVLILAGIASPAPFVEYVTRHCPLAQVLLFSDHHRYTEKEGARIRAAFEPMKATNGIIVTTEKDSVRLKDNPFFESLLPYCYYQTLTIHFLDQTGEQFDKKILDYVRNHQRNRALDSTAHAKST